MSTVGPIQYGPRNSGVLFTYRMWLCLLINVAAVILTVLFLRTCEYLHCCMPWSFISVGAGW